MKNTTTEEIKEQQSLEEKLSETKYQPLQELYPLDDYIKSFSRRYYLEESFRSKVHAYLHLTRSQRIILGLSSLVLPSFHKRRADSIINKYATLIHEDLKKALEIKRDMTELQKIQQESEKRSSILASAEEKYEKIEQEKEKIVVEKEKTQEELKEEMKEELKEKESKIEQQKEEIKEKTDPEFLVREKLKEQVLGMPFVLKDEYGNLRFDDNRMAEKLEEIFLDEVIADIEKEEKPGFFFRLKRKYDGLITHHDFIEDLSEIPYVDWLQSSILSRTRGYRFPVFPYLVTGKSDEKNKVKIAQSLDTAIALDISSSMEINHRFEIAQKATLATHALMRKLNPKNNTSLSVFNSELHEITTAQLIKDTKPYNGTHTEEAIKWLIKKLKDSPMAIAYLITDGEPNHIDSTIEEAKKFPEYENILFRIFLIDGKKDTEEITRKVGLAAGHSTKVLPVKNYQLPNGLIKNIDEALGEMYAIAKF